MITNALVHARNPHHFPPLEPRPCPICGQGGGFHDDQQHRNNIPTDKLLAKDWLKQLSV